jgi:DNA-directed RNA polymerase subunit beta
MSYSFTEKKRIRKSFAKRDKRLTNPISSRYSARILCFVSYRKILAPNKRLNHGLQAAFNSIFPIESHTKNARLDFISYELNDTGIRCEGMSATRT